MADQMTSTVQSHLEKLHSDLLLKFGELQSDNQTMKVRLTNIETKLGLEGPQGGGTSDPLVLGEEKREEIERDKMDPSLQTDLKKDNNCENNVDKVLTDDIEEEFEEDYTDEDDHSEIDEVETVNKEKEVKLEKIQRSSYQGFCFRPLAGWKNSQGKYEISKESVEIDEDEVELKICGFESNEEIAKIIIPLRDVVKAEGVFERKTILFLHVGPDICEAALQSLAMTNISSFSLVDRDTGRIRICFEALPSERRVLLREYFRRRTIYFKTASSSCAKDRIFFRKIRKDVPPKYDSNKAQPLEDFVKTMKTLKFLDRVTYRCKVCDYYNQSKSVVLAHVNRFHVADKRNITNTDIVHIRNIET